jgi:hypothetical protein
LIGAAQFVARVVDRCPEDLDRRKPSRVWRSVFLLCSFNGAQNISPRAECSELDAEILLDEERIFEIISPKSRESFSATGN